MTCGGIFDTQSLEWKLEELEHLLQDGNLWGNPERAKSLQREKTNLEDQLAPFHEITALLSELDAFKELLEEDPECALDDEITVYQNTIQNWMLFDTKSI